MKNSLINYYQSGQQQSKKMLRGKLSLYLTFAIYLTSTFLSRVLVLFYPMIKIIEFNLIEQNKLNKKIDVLNTFKESKQTSLLWNIGFIHMIKILVILSGWILLSGLTLLISFGLSLANHNGLLIMGPINQLLLTLLITFALLFAFFTAVFFEFAISINLSYKDKSIEEALSLSKQCTSMKLFISTFLIVCTHVFFLALYFGVGFAITYYINQFFSVFASVVIGMILLLFYLKTLIRHLLSIKLSFASMYADVIEMSIALPLKENEQTEKYLLNLFNQVGGSK